VSGMNRTRGTNPARRLNIVRFNRLEHYRKLHCDLGCNLPRQIPPNLARTSPLLAVKIAGRLYDTLNRPPENKVGEEDGKPPIHLSLYIDGSETNTISGQHRN
jgi:hypothetical protein